MRVVTRAATKEDLPALASLVAGCASTLRSERGGEQFAAREFLLSPRGAGLETMLSDRDVLVLSGTIDDQVLAIAVVRIEMLADDGLLGRLELLFVDPDAREVGLGEALVRTATTWAAEQGATGLDACTRCPGAEKSRTFWSRRASSPVCWSCTAT